VRLKEKLAVLTVACGGTGRAIASRVDGFMVVTGASINFDVDGSYLNATDAGWIEAAVVAAAKAQGLGMPRYIKPKCGAGYSDEAQSARRSGRYRAIPQVRRRN